MRFFAFLMRLYKLRNPNPNAGAIHKESRQHYLSGRLNPMITVPNTSLREFSQMMHDKWEAKKDNSE